MWTPRAAVLTATCPWREIQNAPVLEVSMQIEMRKIYPKPAVYVSKGRRQNSSVASGDFLQRMTNVGW